MELILSYYFLTFAFLLATILPFLKSKAFPAKPDDSLRLLPGPWQLPIVGSIHHLAVAGSLPHRALRDMSRKYGPLMLLKLGVTPTVVASSVATVKEVMQTQDTTFATRPLSVTLNTLSWGGRDMIFALYGNYWRQMRKVCITKLFTPKRIQGFRSIREEEVKKLMCNITTAMESSPLVDLSELMTAFISNVIVRAITGTTHNKELPKFLRAWGKSIELAAGTNLADLFPSKRWLTDIVSGASYEAERCSCIIGGLLDNIIKMKKERNAITDTTDTEDEDLLDALLKMHEGDGLMTPLQLENIKGVILDLFGAGIETSATTLDWVMSELLRHPSTLKIAQAEVRSILKGKPTVTNEDANKLPYIQNVIRETLRLHPPLPLIPRVSHADCSVAGYDIPKNTKFIVNAWALGRDLKYWDDTDSFRPERFEVHAVSYKGTDQLVYIPFGAGRRQCPATSFGIASVELCLTNLLYHFDWKLPRGMRPDEVDMSELFGVTIRKKKHLYVRPTLRIPCPDV